MKRKIHLKTSHWYIRWENWLFKNYPEAPEWAYGEWLRPLVCMFVGHDIWTDQCYKPEHDHCVYCRKTFPGQGQNRK